ncbi:hypothetical protein BJY52DRAFT_1241921 [Lactarius psammicola]|nr:hypothetical protein BJY52DRAFT_1241921 [Lactarius psammicola]
MQDRYPFQPTTRTTLTRTDTVLDRLFPNPSIRSNGGNSLYSGGTSMVLTSLESHRTHLPMNAAPAVLAQSVDAGRAVEISPSTLSPISPVTSLRDTRERELHAKLSYLPIPLPEVQPTQNGNPRPSHRRESAHYQARPAQADDRPWADASPLRHWSTPGTAAQEHIFTPQPALSRSRKLPRSKGARRTTVPVPRDNEPPLPPFSESSDYHLYLPDTRSPPSRHQQFMTFL